MFHHYAQNIIHYLSIAAAGLSAIASVGMGIIALYYLTKAIKMRIANEKKKAKFYFLCTFASVFLLMVSLFLCSTTSFSWWLDKMEGITFEAAVAILCAVACLVLSTLALREGILANKALKMGDRAVAKIRMKNCTRAWIANAVTAALSSFALFRGALTERWMEITIYTCDGIAMIIMFIYVAFVFGNVGNGKDNKDKPEDGR